MKDFAFSILAPAIARALVQAAGGAAVLGGDAEVKVAGGVAFALTLAWSIWEKRRARKAAAVAPVAAG